MPESWESVPEGPSATRPVYCSVPTSSAIVDWIHAW
jgi:hypothetical protein